MKVKILRNPGLDLIHDLAAKGINVPKECAEGEEKDLNDKAAEKLIELGLAEKIELVKGPK